MAARFKKVISKSRRSSETPGDGSNHVLRTDSIDSMSLDKSPTRASTHSSRSRDGSSKSGSSGVRNYVPGHTKRHRRKIREAELKSAAEGVTRGRPPSATLASPPLPLSRKASSLGENSLLTDDSETETTPQAPALLSRASHTPYLTTSSPLITRKAVPEQNETAYETNNNEATQSAPTLIEPQQPEPSPSPKSPPSIPSPSPSVGLFDKANVLLPASRSNSISSDARGKSPASKFRNVFGRSGKSPRTSPERRLGESVSGVNSPLGRSSTVDVTSPDLPAITLADDAHAKRSKTLPSLESDVRPLTPPTGMIATPVTTVTPPTPTDTRFEIPGSPKREQEAPSKDQAKGDVVVSPSGNMISHRRVRSDSSSSRQPSKLSNSITAPLTPTTEEARSASGGSNTGARTASGSFFSSWVSAAQNAATTFTTLTSQNRSRSGTNASEPSSLKTTTNTIKEEPEGDEPESPRKQLAIETLGSGELNFEQLGLHGEDRGVEGQKPNLGNLRNDSVLQRDITAAKAEDVLAKRAVSAAYERPDVTPVAELPDPMNSARHRDTFSSAMTGEKTPPNGSILESDTTSVKRTNSVRSKLVNRRSRGSSVATGQSALGDLMRASTTALANPATGPRLSGFAIAPKQRNRTFHQQFRSVPEDDYLIEDYSCALQKEILLAGRIYISEGHICFSSNILGWVTTLVISFEEVVNIEREYTALVIPNAIAIQTLHARHTFRSLLSREATFDLMIGIWKVSHPASFQKSVVGKQMVAEEATKEATGTGQSEKGSEKGSEGSSDDDESEDSDENGSASSIVGSEASMAGGSDAGDVKSISRKPSGMNGLPSTQANADGTPGVAASVTAVAGVPETATVDFPGPVAHAPTECDDASTHYDVIIKDEILPAPLGKIFSLMYGPQSGVWARKFLVEDCKSIDLQMEDDKTGLSNEKKSRQYTYIKPLGGSIGPKQTKCITTEELDFFDLEKSVSVTCSTQTPDVPSGNAFVTKTRYCLTWAPGNATRVQMNCTIEWSAKSWLKSPIEKGAKDGQGQYGESLIKALKATVGRPRGMTTASKVSKSKRRDKKGSRKDKSTKVEEEVHKQEDWGLLEPLRGPLWPVRDLARPMLNMQFAVGLIFFILFWQWVRGPSGSAVGSHTGSMTGEKIAAYEEMWHKEESALWDWLEARSGAHAIYSQGGASGGDEKVVKKQAQKQRQKALKGKDAEAKLREQRMGGREMEEAIRLTRGKLEVLEEAMQQNRAVKEKS